MKEELELTGDEKLKSDWRAITDPKEALLAIVEASWCLGGDPYYSDLTEVLFEMAERVGGAPKSRKTEEELAALMRVAMGWVPVNSKWRHLKSGAIYSVVTPALEAGGLKETVVYYNGSTVFTCPMSNFLKKFERV